MRMWTRQKLWLLAVNAASAGLTWIAAADSHYRLLYLEDDALPCGAYSLSDTPPRTQAKKINLLM